MSECLVESDSKLLPTSPAAATVVQSYPRPANAASSNSPPVFQAVFGLHVSSAGLPTTCMSLLGASVMSYAWQRLQLPTSPNPSWNLIPARLLGADSKNLKASPEEMVQFTIFRYQQHLSGSEADEQLVCSISCSLSRLYELFMYCTTDFLVSADGIPSPHSCPFQDDSPGNGKLVPRLPKLSVDAFASYFARTSRCCEIRRSGKSDLLLESFC